MTAALTSVGVQQVTITIANGATTGTATITAVGAGAFIDDQGQTTTDSTTAVSALARVEITNSTTITATRNTSSTDTVTVTAVIVDGDTTNFIKTVQNITTTILTAATTGTTTVTSVTNTNTFINHLGLSTASTLSLTRGWADVTLATTTVTATRGTATGAVVVGSCVVECQGTALNSATQNITWTSAVSGTTFTKTITSITTTQTFIANGGAVFTISATSARTQMASIALASATSVTADVNTAPVSTGSTYAAVVVELAAAMLAQNIQRGTITLAGATSNTATITSSATAQTMTNWLGNSSNLASVTYNVANYKITQTNATTLTETANTSATGTGSYEAVQFNPVSTGNFVTETVTESNSQIIIATDIASFTETQTETDSYIGARTSTPLLFTESQTETDSLTILATGKGLLTEAQTETDSATILSSSSVTRSETTTETDNLSGVIIASDGTTETITSTDTHAALATDNISFSENLAANDNYDSQLTPAGGVTPVTVTGSGNDPWKRHLIWLARKKRKQFKQRAMQAGISKPEAIRIAEIAIQQVQRQETQLKTPYSAIIDQNEQIARHAAQIAINQIYEAIWEQQAREAIAYRQEQIRIQNEEDEFFMMVM